MAEHVAEFEVLGPWSLQTSRRFWEGFTPAALPGEPAGPGLRTVFCAEGDWRRAAAEVTQAGDAARVVLAGDGDLDAAAGQVCRFLALDVDGRGWPQVGRQDPVIAAAQGAAARAAAVRFPFPLRGCGVVGAGAAAAHRAGRPAARGADHPPRRGWRVPSAEHPGPARPGSSGL